MHGWKADDPVLVGFWSETMNRKKLIFLISEDWFFCSHFLDRAIAARAEGYEVAVITRVRRHGGKITEAGLKLHPLEFERRNLNPLAALRTLSRIVRLYRAEQPDLVHHVALKPILLGTLAARWVGVRGIINAPVGMGFVFSSHGVMAMTLRPVVRFLLGRLLNPANSRVIFENPDDRDELVRMGAVKSGAVVLIRGAGVDTAVYSPVEAPPLPVTVMLVARMLWDKGVGEFVKAAHRLTDAGLNARFVLVGDPDPVNPASIPESTLRSWHGQHGIEWWGRREDMPAVLQSAHIACLPSYREGLPKSLLEAAACGLPIVTTDAPGCREVVCNGVNGLLVPVRDIVALTEALGRLIDDAELRRQMGVQSRLRAEKEFGLETVIEQTLAVYHEACA
jgi:glycosyltransferase involved in cell wall biosynthesis